MAAYFFDTCAVVKCYVQEIGTAWVTALADPALGRFVFVARITDVELTAAIARRRRDGSLTRIQASAALMQFRNDLAQDYRVIEVTVPLFQRASSLADRHVLRAYDAVQLAGALEISAQVPSLTFISADADLNTAANAEGLPVDDPNSHP